MYYCSLTESTGSGFTVWGFSVYRTAFWKISGISKVWRYSSFHVSVSLYTLGIQTAQLKYVVEDVTEIKMWEIKMQDQKYLSNNVFVIILLLVMSVCT